MITLLINKLLINNHICQCNAVSTLTPYLGFYRTELLTTTQSFMEKEKRSIMMLEHFMVRRKVGNFVEFARKYLKIPS